MPPNMRQGGRLVVIGGDAAGMSAASRARRVRPDVEIVVLEKGRDVSYAACSLPYYIAGLLHDRSELVARDIEFFRGERQIDVRLGAAVDELLPRKKLVAYQDAVTGERTTLEFDALVIATGARAVKPPLPGIDMPGVFTLRTLADGTAIKEEIDAGGVERATIVGAGYVGLEMAEALTARGIEVTVIELLPNVLSTYDPDMGAIVEKELLAKDVILHKDRRVDGFEPGDRSGRVGYVLTGGQRLATDLVIVAIGVRPAVEFAAAAGVDLGAGGAIHVDARQVASDPFVLAAGDCCEAMHVVTRRPVWIPLGTTANKQGRIAGGNAVGGDSRFGGVAGTNVTKIFDLIAAQTGLTETAAAAEGLDADSATITAASRSHAYPGGGRMTVKLVFEKGTGRVLGAQIVGEERVAKRIDVVAAGLHAGMTVADLAQIDMSYAPPFAPVWDPILVAANQARKKAAG